VEREVEGGRLPPEVPCNAKIGPHVAGLWPRIERRAVSAHTEMMARFVTDRRNSDGRGVIGHCMIVGLLSELGTVGSKTLEIGSVEVTKAGHIAG
jgi:hypothetical protein